MLGVKTSLAGSRSPPVLWDMADIMTPEQKGQTMSRLRGVVDPLITKLNIKQEPNIGILIYYPLIT
jgi:hypothetical protein